MSEPYTGSYEDDSRTLFFDSSIEPILLERHINYEKDHSNNAVTIKVTDTGETLDEVLIGLCISDQDDLYLYSHYNVDANVPENLQSV